MLRPYAVQDAPDVLHLRNQVTGHEVPLDRFLDQDAAWPPDQVRRRVVDVERRTVIGMAEVSHFEYLPPDWLRLTLNVAPASRHRGSGARLYGWVQEQVEDLRPEGLAVSVLDQDPDSRDWALRRGFEMHAHRFASQLNLRSEFPLPEFPSGISLRDMQGVSSTDWDQLEQLYGDLLTQTPDLAGQPRWTPAVLRAAMRDNPRARPEWTLVAADASGAWLGLCQGVTISTGIYNEFTGVIAKARGQGLARALKLELIRRARTAGVLQMRTNNHAANLPMLRVNRRLGFVPLTGSWELWKPRI